MKDSKTYPRCSQHDKLLCNDGSDTLHVPGIGCDIDCILPNGAGFATELVNTEYESLRVTDREIHMLNTMNLITDKPRWNKKIFDEHIVKKWHDEAVRDVPLMSEHSWQWCVQELREKAAFFEQNGFTLTLDTASAVAKSDTHIDDDLQKELLEAVKPLLAREPKDWHPRSEDRVLNLVHPSLFPLVYGHSRVLEREQTDLSRYLEFPNRGVIAAADQKIKVTAPAMTLDRGLSSVKEARWSNRFQWLPCEVKFSGHTGTNVVITSYINNLIPTETRALHTAIEKMIANAIPLWNEVLVSNGSFGRTPPRTWANTAETDPAEPPEWYWNIEDNPEKEGYAESLARLREFVKLEDNPTQVHYSRISAGDEWPVDFLESDWEQRNLEGVMARKWRRIRKVKHPEPGVVYSYEDWKAGKITPKQAYWARYLLKHTRQPVCLEETFRSRGLQVIVKIAGIELTPEKPSYAGGNWHVEGMANEHIVATAIYYFDAENTTESRLAFRQEAMLSDESMEYDQDDHGPLCELFGTDNLRTAPAVQNLGTVATPSGRFIAFPNTLQHKVMPFELADPTRLGHRRFLVLWLVDPHYRVASTANVPPQQAEWWKPQTLDPVLDKSVLPPELKEMVREAHGEWPMGLEEAKKLRLELMDERTRLMPEVEKNYVPYSFCEH